MFLCVEFSANNFQMKGVLLKLKCAVEYLLKAGKYRAVFGRNGKKTRIVVQLSVSLTLQNKNTANRLQPISHADISIK